MFIETLTDDELIGYAIGQSELTALEKELLRRLENLYYNTEERGDDYDHQETES